jgi:hypothetical protein
MSQRRRGSKFINHRVVAVARQDFFINHRGAVDFFSNVTARQQRGRCFFSTSRHGSFLVAMDISEMNHKKMKKEKSHVSEREKRKKPTKRTKEIIQVRH